jgi:hypothetical protein
VRWLVAALLAFVLGTWLLGAPPPERAVAVVARAVIAALGRPGGAGAAYRLTDLDFRAVCPLHRFASSVQARQERYRAVRVRAVHATPPRGLRVSATVVLDTPEGERVERWEFAREGSRWYVYENLQQCGNQ